MTATATSSVGTWHFRWQWVMVRKQHGSDIIVGPWPTFLPHLRHHRNLVLFVFTDLDTMLRHERQWNEPAMGNSVVAVGAMKSMSMAVTPVSALRMEEHRRTEVNEHGQRWRVEQQ
jgi:hypothetical protein